MGSDSVLLQDTIPGGGQSREGAPYRPPGIGTHSMPAKPPGRTRPVDVAIPLDLNLFLAELARATQWGGDTRAFTGEGGRTVPGSFTGEGSTDHTGRFSVDYLWSNILSKYDDSIKSSTKQDVAMQKFAEAEELCGQTNARLIAFRNKMSYPVTEVEQAIMLARKNIRAILGTFDWNRAAVGFSFTTGATTRLNRRHGSPLYKYSGTPETTYGNANLAYCAISQVPLWKERLCSEEGPMHLKLVHGNRVTTVPKNYKSDRIIAIEPDMNMYIQKGLGTYIRSRLKSAGMDLNTQERNQRLARIGSFAGTMATIDMSMASDTVSSELVRLLLEGPWADALEQCRSPMGVLPCGKKVFYRKFSSMGNGYTFELESLIFWALALACCRLTGAEARRTVAYGDDVILPTAAAPLFLQTLEFCGFKPNEDKSFISGPFRESCGKHYLRGHDVSPFFIRKAPKRLSDLFLLHNNLRRWVDRNADYGLIDVEACRALLARLRSLAPSNWRKPRIPDGIGDGAFIGSFDECTPTAANTYVPGKLGKRDGWEGWICQVLVEKSIYLDYYESSDGEVYWGEKENRRSHDRRPPDPVGRILQALLNAGSSEPVRGGLSLDPRVRLGQLIVRQWPM